MKMNMRKSAVALLVLSAGMALAAGCEDASTGDALQVDPAENTLVGRGATVLLTASMADEGVNALSASNRSEMVILPLEWSVRNGGLGEIMESAGYTAVYRSSGNIGQNVVFCRDPYGREGLAVINQYEELPETSGEADAEGAD